jgi:hypothetical protein
MSQLSETQSANAEFPHISARPAAEGATVALPHAVFLFVLKFNDV